MPLETYPVTALSPLSSVFPRSRCSIIYGTAPNLTNGAAPPTLRSVLYVKDGRGGDMAQLQVITLKALDPRRLPGKCRSAVQRYRLAAVLLVALGPLPLFACFAPFPNRADSSVRVDMYAVARMRSRTSSSRVGLTSQLERSGTWPCKLSGTQTSWHISIEESQPLEGMEGYNRGKEIPTEGSADTVKLHC
jgi:hypothetical protein